MKHVTIILSEREVFADCDSVSLKELYDASVLDLKPEYHFDVLILEYQNEKTLIYNDVKYSIYRTFEKGEKMELYVERKTGVR